MTGHEGLSSRQTIPELKTPRFKVEFEYFWMQLSSWVDYLSVQELGEQKEGTLKKEISFYNKVYSAVDDAVQGLVGSSGTAVCLFDVDGTIGEVKDEIFQHEEVNQEFPNEISKDYAIPKLHTLLRPSVIPLVTSLGVKHPEYLRFGILSNRTQKSLDDEMENPTFLAPIRPFMDEKYAFSSKSEELSDPIWREEATPTYIREVLKSLRGVVDKNIVDQTLEGNVNIHHWYDPKLQMIAQFLKFNPNVCVIYVDNLPCASVFEPSNERITGVNVSNERPLLIPGL